MKDNMYTTVGGSMRGGLILSILCTALMCRAETTREPRDPATTVESEELTPPLANNAGGTSLVGSTSPTLVNLCPPILPCLERLGQVENPPRPTNIREMKIPTIKEANSRRYILMTELENPGFLISFDVTDPQNPFRLPGSVTIANVPNSVDLSGDTLFVPTNTGRIYAINVSDPTSLSLDSFLTISFGDQIFDVAINENVNRAYAAGTTTGSNASGLVIVNVSDPTAMTFQNNIDFNAGGVVTRDNFVYVSEFTGTPQVRIYDISSNPDNPTLRGQAALTPGNTPVSLALHPNQNLLYVADIFNETLNVLDINDVDNPQFIATFRISGDRQPNYGSMQFFGDLLFVTSINGFVNIFDSVLPGTRILPELAFDLGAPNLESATISDDGLMYIPERTDRGFGDPPPPDTPPNNMKIFKIKSCSISTLE